MAAAAARSASWSPKPSASRITIKSSSPWLRRRAACPTSSSPTTYSSGFFSSQYLPLSESIFISEAQVIRDIAAKESAVIVGRCADYILAGRDNTINVFVYAPREVRVNRIMARHNLSEAEALKAISTSDKERGNHYFRYTDQKWGKAQNYDVCINSGLMGIEKTAEMLADMAKIEVRA